MKIAAFERVGAPAVELVGDGRQQAVARAHRHAAGIEQREAAGAVGRLDHAGLDAGLADRRRLLVARHAEHRDRRAEDVGGRDAELGGVVDHLGSIDGGTPSSLQSSGSHVPLRISSSRVRLALVASLACTLPPVSRHSRKLSIVPAASAPLSAAARAPGDVLQDPGDLGAREIGIEQQAGLVRDGFSWPPRFSSAHTSEVRRSCQTMALCTGLPVARSHTTVGLALVGDADAGERRGRRPGLGQRLAADLDGGAPDLFGIVLDPAGLGEDLRQFLLRRRHGPARAKSNTIARVLVVPWSMARICFAAMRPRLVRPVDGEVYRFEQRRLQRRIAEQAHRVACHGAVVAGALERVGQRIVALDQGSAPATGRRRAGRASRWCASRTRDRRRRRAGRTG